MPWRPSTSAQVRASAIWPTAAAAWLSSSFSVAARQLQDAAAERDGAGGNHQHVAALLVQGGDVGGQCFQPVMLQTPGGSIHQERGADLHHDAAEIGERRGFGGHCGLEQRGVRRVV